MCIRMRTSQEVENVLHGEGFLQRGKAKYDNQQKQDIGFYVTLQENKEIIKSLQAQTENKEMAQLKSATNEMTPSMRQFVQLEFCKDYRHRVTPPLFHYVDTSMTTGFNPSASSQVQDVRYDGGDGYEAHNVVGGVSAQHSEGFARKRRFSPLVLILSQSPNVKVGIVANLELMLRYFLQRTVLMKVDILSKDLFCGGPK